jgi:hypothetical protein
MISDMYMYIKSGKNRCSLNGIQPEIANSHPIVAGVYARLGYDCVLTSGTDYVEGRHPRSKHPQGLALDYRTNHIPENLRQVLADKVKEALGDQFDVVLKSDHLHTEFDPPEARDE